MRKVYIQPSMRAIKLQNMTWLLAGSGDETEDLQSSGWDNPDDKLNLNKQGGDNSIWDR